MGTTGDWLSVLLSGGFYGVAMGLWNTPQKAAIGTRKSWLVEWMFAGLLFGILSTHGWRRAFIHQSFSSQSRRVPEFLC